MSSPGSPFHDRAEHPLAGATVLQIVPGLDPGPAADAAIAAAAALGRAGAKALVASRGGSQVAELQALGGLFSPFPAGARDPLGMALAARRLARVVASEGVDIVHARSRATAWIAYAATRLTGTPLVTSFPGAYARGGPLALRYNAVMARGDVILVDSPFTAALVEKMFPAARGRVRVAPPGVDCRRFAPKATPAARVQAARQAWGATQVERIVFCVAAIDSAAAVASLIDAVKLVAQNAASAADAPRFVIALEAGRAVAAAVAAAIADARLGQNLTVCAAAGDRPAALLAAAAVVALPGRPETLAGLALEAQAMGTPVIVAGAGAAAEAILAPPEVDAGDRTGWRTAAEAAPLADALRAALALGAAARDRLALRARTHVETRFTFEQGLAGLLDAYAAARRGAL